MTETSGCAEIPDAETESVIVTECNGPGAIYECDKVIYLKGL